MDAMGRRLLLYIVFLLICRNLTAQVSNNLDSLLTAEKTLPPGPEKIKLLRDIGFNYSRKDSEKALDYLKQAITLGEQINENKYTISSYSQIAMLYNNLGDISRADSYLDETLKRAKKVNEDATWASYYQAATLIYKKRKKLKEAVLYAQKALEYSRKAGTGKANIAGAHLNLANAYTDSQQFELAVRSYYNALSLFDEVKNESGQAYCYNSLANVQRELGLYRESLENTRKSLALKEKNKDEKGVAASRQVIAQNYYDLKQPEKALAYLDKSTAFFREQGLFFDMVNNYHLKARIYHQMKDTLNAAKYYDLAIAEAGKLDAPALVSTLEKEKARKIQSFGFSDKNKNLHDLALAKQSGDTMAIMNTLSFLATLDYREGRYKSAYDYREEYLALHEKIYSPDILKQLKQLESQYELRKKENDIRLLEKDKLLDAARLHQHKIALYASVALILLTVLSGYLLFKRIRTLQADKRKQELETMRNTIASDLHDDIGSTLSSIQIISKMAMMQCNGNVQLRQSVDRIAELSDKVSDGIREIVWSVNPAYDKLGAVITQWRKLAADLLGTNGILFQFTEEIKDPEAGLTPEQRKDLLMIFKEAINNARKYSGTGRVDIHVKQSEQLLSIQIKDHGCGFDQEKITPGNGLRNMKYRAEAINGHLEIYSRTGKGTFLSLEVPLS